MFGLGPPELALILLAALLLFGASKLPELGKGLGEGIREFRQVGREQTRDAEQQGESDS